jgi:uncharacterized protein (TIGR02001 family)
MAIRRTAFVLGALLAAAPSPTAAAGIDAEDFTVYVTLVSDYVLYGYSQTEENPALQAGVDFEHPGGIFAGVRLSNVEFPPAGSVEDPRDLEIHLFAGYGLELGGGLALSAGLVHYEYPGSGNAIDWDYTELDLALQYRNAALSVGFSDSALGSGYDGIAVGLVGRWALRRRVELTTGVGYYDLEAPYLMDYLYWNAELSRTWKRLTFTLGYVDTDDRGRQIWGDLAGSRLVGGVRIRAH